MRGKQATPHQIEQIKTMRAAGESCRAVAQAVGVGHTTVHKYAPNQPTRGLPDHTIARIRSLRYQDGYTCRQVAAMIGCSESTINKIAPGRPGKVPVAPLREAFLASPVTAPEVARSLGWWLYGSADGSRVKRTLGINLETTHGRRIRRTLADAEVVQLIAEAIGVAPWSVMPDDAYPSPMGVSA